MKVQKATRKVLQMHWVPVVDANGDVHLEGSWSRDKIADDSATVA
jgi:hypothetical protein